MRESVSPRWRTVLRLRAPLIMAIVVVTLLWGADAVARNGAEALVARDVQGATGAAVPPEVVVQGRFFLPQVMRGAYDEVDVTTTGLESGPLRIDRVESRLIDVRVPFRDVLLQDVRSLGVGRSEQRVTLRYEDLNAYFAATGRPLSVLPTESSNLVEVNGESTVLARRIEVRAQVLLAVLDGNLRLTPQTIDFGSSDLSTAAQALLTQRLTLAVPLSNLPFGHDLTAVTAGPESIVVEAESVGIVVQP